MHMYVKCIMLLNRIVKERKIKTKKLLAWITEQIQSFFSYFRVLYHIQYRATRLVHSIRVRRINRESFSAVEKEERRKKNVGKYFFYLQYYKKNIYNSSSALLLLLLLYTTIFALSLSHSLTDSLSFSVSESFCIFFEKFYYSCDCCLEVKCIKDYRGEEH